MIGSQIAQYLIQEKLGEGGMGIVFKALDTKLERTVALKLLRPETLNDPDTKARFLREARAASKLNHPNITTIYEIGEWHGRDYISMEYVEGQTLKRKLKPGPLSIDEVLNIAEQLADALREAHEHGIVH
ncbi:MAG: serine/threonine protein kinase, partial [bacterium]